MVSRLDSYGIATPSKCYAIAIRPAIIISNCFTALYEIAPKIAENRVFRSKVGPRGFRGPSRASQNTNFLYKAITLLHPSADSLRRAPAYPPHIAGPLQQNQTNIKKPSKSKRCQIKVVSLHHYCNNTIIIFFD